MTAEAYNKLPNVYGTSRDVPKTYVERAGVDDRFLNDITRDKHLVIHGGSKQGKTCLRKYHLNENDYVVVQCTRETTKAKLYEMLLKKAGIDSEVTTSRTITGGWKLNVKVGAEGKVPFVAKATGETSGEYEHESAQTIEAREFEIDPEDPNDIAHVLNKAGFSKYIVIEDFHYLDEDAQRSLAVDLKVFHENSKLIFVIVGVWLEANRLTLYNGDLSGRLATINADRWEEKDLLRVISEGEPLLNIAFPDSVKSAVVAACQNNVGLLQEVLYRICEKYNIWQTQDKFKEIGTVGDVDEMLKAVSEEQATRYRNFLSRFAEGLGQTQLEMYRWLLYVIVKAKPEELRRGLRPNIIFQRTKAAHPSANTLQQNNVVQALERVGTVQFKHKLQPLILDYSNGELMVVDANFIVFLQTHGEQELIEYIGLCLANTYQASVVKRQTGTHHGGGAAAARRQVKRRHR